MLVGLVQVRALALVLPAEPALGVHVGKTLAPGHLQHGLLEAVLLAARGPWHPEQVTQVNEMELCAATFVEPGGGVFLDKSVGGDGHGWGQYAARLRATHVSLSTQSSRCAIIVSFYGSTKAFLDRQPTVGHAASLSTRALPGSVADDSDSMRAEATAP